MGAPCPVEPALCEAAFDILARAHAGDWRGMLAATTPQTLACPAQGQPFPVTVFNPGDVCDGAAPGDIRPYFIATGDSGEGQVMSPGRFSKVLEEYVTALPYPALEWDAYGPGDLVIAAVACFRSDGPAGVCSGQWARVALTGIRDGERRVACLGLHREPAGARWILDGLGCGEPRRYLYAFTIPGAAISEQVRGTIENYPWTPLARNALPPAALAALQANLPAPVPLSGECQVAPRAAPIALCYTGVVTTADGVEVSFGYHGTSSGWKAKLTRLPDGAYRVDSVEQQFI